MLQSITAGDHPMGLVGRDSVWKVYYRPYSEPVAGEYN